MNKVYGMGDVADICRVTAHTAAKWVDNGTLRGYRIPGSKHRRVMVEDLRDFMVANGIPLRGLEERSVQSTCPKCIGKREFFVPGVGFQACGRCGGGGVIYAEVKA